MSQSGYTPIQLYRTATTATAPSAGNLTDGELAINYNTADMALYAKNSAGSVKSLINNPAGLKYPTADGTASQLIKTDGAGNLSFVTVAAGGGTVTSVGFTGGIITVASPTTTPAFTVAGTSGGIPYFGSSSTWTSSAALAANGIMYGGGAGASPSATAAGTTGQVLTGVTSGAPAWSATPSINQVNYPNNPVTVTSNAGTVPITYRLNTFTNSSAATMTITMATASAADGQMSIVRIYDFSAVAQTISWVNTENSSVLVPTTSNGSTTLPKTVGFMYNSATSKWRCVATA